MPRPNFRLQAQEPEMPIVQIKLPKGFASEQQMEKVRLGAKASVLKTLSPKDSRHDYVVVSEEIGKIGDGLPLVLVDMRPGREHERKEAFAKFVSESIASELGIDAKTVYVLYRESDPSNFFVGDGFLPGWEPGQH
jgi:phenylpyruvate tautomerase PptA (4-oxalocrotonate tautomerase family)